MKERVSTPLAVGAVVVVVLLIGIFVYTRQTMAAGPPPESKEAARGITAQPIQPRQIPHTKEEGMALYRQMSNRGK
jgi:hypothetical protein